MSLGNKTQRVAVLTAAAVTAVAVTVLSHNVGQLLIHVGVVAASCSLTGHQRGFLGFTSKTKASVVWFFSRIRGADYYVREIKPKFLN